MSQALTRDDRALATDIEKYKAEIAKLVPRAVGAERFIRIVFNALRDDYLRQVATRSQQGRESFIGAMLTCAQLGLEPDKRNAALVPYKNEITLIPMYQGLCRLMYNTGKVSGIVANEVYEGDTFEHWEGLREDHLRLARCSPDMRGEIRLFYAVVRQKEGDPILRVMPREDVDRIRDRALASKKNVDRSPWTTDYVEMGRKTPLRAVFKLSPSSPAIQQAVDLDEMMAQGSPIIRYEREARAQIVKPEGDAIGDHEREATFRDVESLRESVGEGKAPTKHKAEPVTSETAEDPPAAGDAFERAMESAWPAEDLPTDPETGLVSGVDEAELDDVSMKDVPYWPDLAKMKIGTSGRLAHLAEKTWAEIVSRDEMQSVLESIKKSALKLRDDGKSELIGKTQRASLRAAAARERYLYEIAQESPEGADAAQE